MGDVFSTGPITGIHLDRMHLDHHVINTNDDPFCPDGWTVVKHRRNGLFVWKYFFVTILLNTQKDGKWIKGSELQKQLASFSNLLNANCLDYLLNHPNSIPKAWEDQFVFFWGTVYNRYGRLCVRYLFSGTPGTWSWYYHDLEDAWHSDCPAAVG